MFNSNYQCREVYFKGDKVILSGEICEIHGGMFCIGEFAEGFLNGQPAWVAQDYADKYMQPVAAAE